MTDELWRRGSRQLAADIAAKRITSREVVEAHLARIAAVNPAVPKDIALKAPNPGGIGITHSPLSRAYSA